MADNEFVWHARRFWVQEPTGDQHLGWNTRFEPCWVMKKTAKQVHILSPSLGKLWLNREKLEREGKVYHSKPHEYFYAVHPGVDPEKIRYGQMWTDAWKLLGGGHPAFAVLGLQQGCSKPDIKRAYKKLARRAHPDFGGSHEAFIELNKAYEEAMRLTS